MVQIPPQRAVVRIIYYTDSGDFSAWSLVSAQETLAGNCGTDSRDQMRSGNMQLDAEAH